MPRYDYINDDTGEIREIVQTMSENHVYFDEAGKQWRRIFCVPQASVDANIDPFDQNKFVEKTGKNKGTIGELWERSADLSAQRAEKRDGVDVIKQKHFDNYRKKTGKEMYHETKEKSKNIEINLPAFPK
jgi:hypothetical protein